MNLKKDRCKNLPEPRNSGRQNSHLLTRPPAHPPACAPARLYRPPACVQGFTVLEVLISVTLITLLATLVVTSMGKFDDDVKIAVALKDMKTLKTTLAQRVYPDMGKIPCGPREGADDKRKRMESLFVPAYLFMEIEMIRDMYKNDNGDDSNNPYKDHVIPDYITQWAVYKSSGWRGPYLRGPTGAIDATYFAPEDFPKIAGSNVFLDAMLTPWADYCEEKAAAAEARGNQEMARLYRQGKYYHIVGPGKLYHGGKYVIPPSTAVIVSRGSDCLPGARAVLDSIVDPCIESCSSRWNVDSYCKEMCTGAKIPRNFVAFKECTEDICPLKLAQKSNECLRECSSAGFKALQVTDPDSPGYVDIGDDIIMSVFGNLRRSPME